MTLRAEAHCARSPARASERAADRWQRQPRVTKGTFSGVPQIVRSDQHVHYDHSPRLPITERNQSRPSALLLMTTPYTDSLAKPFMSNLEREATPSAFNEICWSPLEQELTRLGCSGKVGIVTDRNLAGALSQEGEPRS